MAHLQLASLANTFTKMFPLGRKSFIATKPNPRRISYKEQCRVVREEVKMIVCKVVNHIDQLELIDVLQKLVVAYHFNKEIVNILDNIYNMDTSKWKKDLHATVLKFRLLRQHGYDISADIFTSFQDETGSFKKCESVDAERMLSLYEASFHSLEDETTLDEARDFTFCLNTILDETILSLDIG